MNFKLKAGLFLKKDNSGNGILLNAEDEGNRYIKLNHLALDVVDQMLQGKEINAIKKEILHEYNVSTKILGEDLKDLFEKLKEVKFLEND